MKILKMKLYQETACYRKPFAFKVAETYPLPPYSTIIGMLHNILDAKNGETYKFDISIQGTYSNTFQNYIYFRKFLNDKEKEKYNNADAIRKPLYVIELVDVNLILHIKADDEIIDKLYKNITKKGKAIALGKNEYLTRLDYINIVESRKVAEKCETKYNAYIKRENSDFGTNFRLDTYYTVKNNLRKWEKVDVKYIEEGTLVSNCEIDNENDLIFFALNS